MDIKSAEFQIEIKILKILKLMQILLIDNKVSNTQFKTIFAVNAEKQLIEIHEKYKFWLTGFVYPVKMKHEQPIV